MSCSSLDLRLPSRTDRIVYGVAAGLWLLNVAIGVLYVVRNRSQQLIAKRQPFFMVVLFLSFGVFVGLAFIRIISPKANCAGMNIPLFTSLVFTFNVLLVRMYLLYLSHRIANASLEFYEIDQAAKSIVSQYDSQKIKTQKLEKTNSQSKLHSLKKNASFRKLLGIFLVKTILETIPIAIVAIYFRENMTTLNSCIDCISTLRFFFLSIFGPALYNLAISLFIYQKIRGADDSLGIKSEFKTYLLGAFSAVILAAVFQFSDVDERYDRYLNSANLIVLGFPMIFVSISLSRIFSIYNSKAPVKRKASRIPIGILPDTTHELLDLSRSPKDDIELFDLILANDTNRELFRQHLQKEFNVENILFWQDLQELKKCSDQDPSTRAQKAKKLYEQYIPVDSLLSVNISGVARIRLTYLFEECSEEYWNAQVFRDAEKQIYNLMFLDTFPRFRRSPLFLECVLE